MTLPMPPEFAPLGLTRDEKHVYCWSDGKEPVTWPIPSVTGIIKLIDKSGPLVGWAKRETAASAIRNHDALTALIKEGMESGGQSAAFRSCSIAPSTCSRSSPPICRRTPPR